MYSLKENQPHILVPSELDQVFICWHWSETSAVAACTKVNVTFEFVLPDVNEGRRIDHGGLEIVDHLVHTFDRGPFRSG